MESGQSSTYRNRPRMSYDVFISFRGTDTRNTFIGFLYDALRRLGLRTFMDDKKILMGDHLGKKLMKAIEESRFSIVILSKNYASSKWCLKELTKIIAMMGGQTDQVLPVFYHVAPSDVRHQSGSFEQSFHLHEHVAAEFSGEQREKYLEEVRNWKDSMTKIGNLSGLVVTDQSPEVDIIKQITKQIFDRCRPKLVTFDKNLVGMRYPLEQMNVDLGLGLDDVRFIGMVGMGGIGKTTVAKVVYDCITSKFDGSCFLHILGDTSSSKQSSLVSLQEQLLSHFCLKDNIKIWDENSGAEMIGNRLRTKKVLLVLDGIEKKEQLNMLARGPHWFGPGSRVIITTRNKDLLHQPYKIHEFNVKLLDAYSSLQLFRNHAFGIEYINGNFLNLSKEIVDKLGRLPIALKVIGSYLNKKSWVIWKETLNRLMKVDEENLFEVLKISYDGLGAESQKVFLDLACFFNGKRKDKVIKILESFGYNPYSELQLLMERCLLEFSHTKILMHEMIEALGQEIVRRDSLTHPGKQIRIWLQDDVVRAFAVKHGLEYTEGIVLNLEKKQKEFRLEAKLFERMTYLRILEIHNVQLSGTIEFLSNLLGFLNWPGYPLKRLPSNFSSTCLLELHLPHSSIEKLWKGKKEFEKLKVIDVRDSQYLLETPDFSMVANLESLVLSKCRSLRHIHPSINDLNRLIFLNLQECPSLKCFSSNLSCKSLECLILSNSGLISFPEIEGSMKHLRRLLLNKTAINTLHSSIKHLVGLIYLDLSNCTMLSSLPNEIGNLKSLHTLLLGGCVSLVKIPSSLGDAKCLKHLDISKTSISGVPSTIKNLEKLICEGLSRIVWHSLLPPCNILRSDLEISADSNFGLESLQYLSLKDCNLVDEDIPEDLHCFPSLRYLDLSRNNFVCLPKSIHHLKNLEELRLHDCFQLKHIPRKLQTNLVPIISTTDSGTRTRLTTLPIQYRHNKPFVLEFIPETDFNLDPKAYEEAIYLKGAMFSSTNDNVEVLECFDEIREGSMVEVEYYSPTNDENCPYGVILSACIQQYSQNSVHNEVIAFYFKFLIEISFEGSPNVITCPWTSKFTSRTRIWMLFIPSHILPKQRVVCFKIKVIGTVPAFDIQRCGASVLFQQKAPTFLANIFNGMFCNQNTFYIATRGGCNHGNECSCDEPETAEKYYSTQFVQNESDSFSLLQMNFKTILQRTYEEEKHYSLSYFFPQDQVPSWFRVHQPKDTVPMKLPFNLFRDKKWKGLAVFAIFSVNEFVHNHSFYFQICPDEDVRHLVKGGSYSSDSFFIPLSLHFSHRILFVRFVPRCMFPYEQAELSHFYVSFITKASRLGVESCGARLVYRHNVDGLLQTIIDCVVKSGEKLCQDYTEAILRDGLRTYHRPTWIQVPAADPETASASSDSSGYHSTKKLPHEGFQDLFLKKSILERYKSKFDVIIHRKPQDFFASQNMGNEGTERIPKALCLLKKKVGVLVCAVVAINKKLAKLERISEPRSRFKVLELKCEFQVDSYGVEPKHRHFVPTEMLLSRYKSSFIWLFFIPFAAFSGIPWIYCNYLRIKVSTNYEELFHVQACGLCLLCQTERKMVDNFLLYTS